jgi:hypothetical protein
MPVQRHTIFRRCTMYIDSRFVHNCIFVILVLSVLSSGQELYFITNSDSPEATAYNNSHKVALRSGEGPNDTINVVFHTLDSVYVVLTTNGGQTWSTPASIGQGKSPVIDVNLFGFRHVAWQSPDYEIYYDCLDDWAPSVNVSQSTTMSTQPDLVADSNGLVHVVWVEQIDRYDHVFYRTVIGGGVVSDTLRISGYGSAEATYDHPSIGIFYPYYRLYALWQCYDSLCYSPYQIHYRCKEDTLWSATTVWAHYLPMRHPSIDYAHGQPHDTLSFCYEDSTSGNMEATFCGGNGGGYQTQGNSTHPVVSTVGPTWSYLFWQEDSAGYQDIYYDLYYEFSGWTNGSLRTTFNIQESVRFPSVSGAYVVWTQGESAPYSIYFADFGYPIGIRESGQSSMTTITATPNPFNELTRLTFTIPARKNEVQLRVYDSSGRLVKILHPKTTMPGTLPSEEQQRLSVVWDGVDMGGNELPAGVYWCYMIDTNQKLAIKVIKVD